MLLWLRLLRALGLGRHSRLIGRRRCRTAFVRSLRGPNIRATPGTQAPSPTAKPTFTSGRPPETAATQPLRCLWRRYLRAGLTRAARLAPSPSVTSAPRRCVLPLEAIAASSATETTSPTIIHRAGLPHHVSAPKTKTPSLRTPRATLKTRTGSTSPAEARSSAFGRTKPKPGPRGRPTAAWARRSATWAESVVSTDRRRVISLRTGTPTRTCGSGLRTWRPAPRSSPHPRSLILLICRGLTFQPGSRSRATAIASATPSGKCHAGHNQRSQPNYNRHFESCSHFQFLSVHT